MTSDSRSLLWIEVPPGRPRFETFDFAQFRRGNVDLNAVTVSNRICAECGCRLQRRLARNKPADAFAVAKQRPPDRSLDDVINVTSHRSPSLQPYANCKRWTIPPYFAALSHTKVGGRAPNFALDLGCEQTGDQHDIATIRCGDISHLDIVRCQ